MQTRTTVGSRHMIAIAAALCVGAAWAPRARAQTPTINPGTNAGPQPPSSGPPSSPYATPAMRRQRTILLNQSSPQSASAATGGKGNAKGGAARRYYHYDDLLGQESGGSLVPVGSDHTLDHAPQQDVHVVQPKDTLWGISQLYFDDPYKWPKLWALNPQITNPHWIYPGDVIRLRPQPAGQSPQPAPKSAKSSSKLTSVASLPQKSPPRRTASFSLRQLAFIGNGALKMSTKISGAPEEREMLARGDDVYISAAGASHLQVGKRYAVYAKKKQVRDPHTGKVVGWYVKLLGEVKIQRITRGEPAQAVITRSYNVIERGERVGPIARKYAQVDIRPAHRRLTATIVGTLRADTLIGASQVVVLDRGSADGLALGNPLEVVRRGDAYSKVMQPASLVGQDDPRFPRRIIGQVIVVDVGTRTALAVVTTSSKEVGIGDRLIMKATAR